MINFLICDKGIIINQWHPSVSSIINDLQLLYPLMADIVLFIAFPVAWVLLFEVCFNLNYFKELLGALQNKETHTAFIK